MSGWLKKGPRKAFWRLAALVIAAWIAARIAEFSPTNFLADRIFPSIERKLISSIERKLPSSVEDKLISLVTNKIDPDKYIEKYLSKGRFVPIKEKDFASGENEIESIKFSMNNSEKRYVALKELKDVERNLQNSLENIQSILDARSENSITVEIYKSGRDEEEEKERLILNGKNEAISHWIKHGYCYKIEPTKGGGHLHIKVSVHNAGVTRPDKRETNDPIGRLHQKHKDSLFIGKTGDAGLNKIEVVLTPASENCNDLSNEG